MAKKKEKRAGRRMKKEELPEVALDLFHAKQDEAINLKYIFSELKLTTHPLKIFHTDILFDLLVDDYITKVSKNKYKLSNHGVEMTRASQRKSDGKNSFVPRGGGDLIFVVECNSAHTMNSDRVYITFYAKRRGHEAEGEVIETLERANDTFASTLEVERSYVFLVTENHTFANDTFVPKNKLKDGKTDNRIVAEATEWPDKAKSPVGQILDILDKAGNSTTEMHAILVGSGLLHVYPRSIEKVAGKILAEISVKEIVRYEDFRRVATFTIGPKDARDFDDALSIRPLKNGLWEVGVHIADVAHYAKEGSIIDEEAEKCVTFVYLINRTTPMLSKRLYNFIRSLRSNEEKPAPSAIFDVTEKGEMGDSRIIYVTVESDHRFAYEEAQQIIETKEGDFKDEILMFDTIVRTLRGKCFVARAINFDRYEAKFGIDEEGKPISAYFEESRDASKLVEEFMLFANHTVVEKVGKVPRGKKAKMLPYRIHDLPDLEKLDSLVQLIARFGCRLRTSGIKTDISKLINRLLDDIQGKRKEDLIETVPIRAMQKACYFTHSIGHYELTSDYHTHFTSPIRHFPNTIVRRLATKYMNGGRSVSEMKYEDLYDHSSSMEQIAVSAEWASIRYKQVEFMSEHLGQTYGEVISGVAEWGLYVKLNENRCEGMIPTRDLDDNYYKFDERSYCLRGRRKDRIYSLGDTTIIKTARTSLEKKRPDLALIE